jgi:hypothetical protein
LYAIDVQTLLNGTEAEIEKGSGTKCHSDGNGRYRNENQYALVKGETVGQILSASSKLPVPLTIGFLAKTQSNCSADIEYIKTRKSSRH